MNKRKEIRNLALVMGSGVLSALLLVGVMLYQYNPTGRYLAKNALLSPLIMNQISYPETNPRTGEISRYVFDSLEFSNFEPGKKEWMRLPVAEATYREFYQAVGEDLSILPISEEMQRLFSQGALPTLTLRMRQQGRSEEKVVFQEVHFAPGGDFYRVQLRTDQVDPWAYFFHPGIERYAKALFNTEIK